MGIHVRDNGAAGVRPTLARHHVTNLVNSILVDPIEWWTWPTNKTPQRVEAGGVHFHRCCSSWQWTQFRGYLIEQLKRGCCNRLGKHQSDFGRAFYADDVAVFVKPNPQDILNLQNLLQSFGEATGLFTNIQKSACYPIWCDDNTMQSVRAAFARQIGQFPCRYLGLPLCLHGTRRADEQILIDKIAAKLPGWKGRLLNKARRLTLVSSVLSAIPTYYISVLPLSKWAIKQIDRIRRNFIWKGDDSARGGNCQVNWRRVCRPKKLDGLGIHDLKNFGRALWLRWMWYKWTNDSKPWIGLRIESTKIEPDFPSMHTCHSWQWTENQLLAWLLAKWINT
jgi:hypothetical protein